MNVGRLAGVYLVVYVDLGGYIPCSQKGRGKAWRLCKDQANQQPFCIQGSTQACIDSTREFISYIPCHHTVHTVTTSSGGSYQNET